jgi:hypothetical protein
MYSPENLVADAGATSGADGDSTSGAGDVAAVLADVTG